MGSSIDGMMDIIGMQAKAAAARLAYASSEQKVEALMLAADAVQRQSAEIIAANAEDLAFGRDKGLSDPRWTVSCWTVTGLEASVQLCGMWQNRRILSGGNWTNGAGPAAYISKRLQPLSV